MQDASPIHSNSSTSALESLRVPPHSEEAEQAVLGGLMLDNEVWDQVADQLDPEDFYRRDHRLIYEAIRERIESNTPADAVTLSEWLNERHRLEMAGGLQYLAGLAKDTPTAANVRAYADIVRERSVLRQLISTGTSIVDNAMNADGRSIVELVDEAEQRVFRIAERGARSKRTYRPIKELLRETVDHIESLSEADSSVTGVASGITAFDEQTAGLQNGDLVIIAGRPSMGKTSFAMNLVENAAIGSKIPTAVFSMEMSGEQLALRMISSLGRVDQSRVRTGRLDDNDWPKISSSIALMSEAPMFIDDGGALSPTDIKARARRLQREYGIGLIVIDYLQLMQVPGNKENRATVISDISRNLKAVAKELNIPVVALSQLNRNLEQRNDKRPVMSDLRESGSIEQDADLIVFIYRDEVYDDNSPDKGTAEVIIGKQRNGPTGMIRTTFLGQYTRFENYIPDSFGDEFQ